MSWKQLLVCIKMELTSRGKKYYCSYTPTWPPWRHIQTIRDWSTVHYRKKEGASIKKWTWNQRQEDLTTTWHNTLSKVSNDNWQNIKKCKILSRRGNIFSGNHSTTVLTRTYRQKLLMGSMRYLDIQSLYAWLMPMSSRQGNQPGLLYHGRGRKILPYPLNRLLRYIFRS